MTKPTKWHVRPAKTQVSLGIRPVWPESSLSAWRKLGSLLTLLSAQRRLWSDWADVQADLSLRWAYIPFCRFCHALAHILCVTWQSNILMSRNVRKHIHHENMPIYFDPLKPHFYIVKLGFTGVYIIFLIFAQNRGGSNEYPQSKFWAEIWKK